MVNYLGILRNPQIRYNVFLEVMRDFRKGGLNPENFEEVINILNRLSIFQDITPIHYLELSKFNLTNISDDDLQVIIQEVQKRGIQKCKKCWHPNASSTTCDLDNFGNLKVSAAHSIQNNGILNRIGENGHVMTYSFDKGEYKGKNKGKNLASVFWGFCNTHDGIFRPIEVEPYNQTIEQNFLFAYRGFVVSSHKKIEGAYLMNFGEQSDKDIEENKKIFDNAILKQQYDILETIVIELPAFYPIATSSCFYLDFDFEGNPISHSDERMENIFISLFPTDKKTYFLISYFKIDRPLYGNLEQQLRTRGNLKSDITMLIGAHVENVYFNPKYYSTFIHQHEKSLLQLLKETQNDFVQKDFETGEEIITSMTPNNYLKNIYDVNFFGY